jgi:hypothetical protein
MMEVLLFNMTPFHGDEDQLPPFQCSIFAIGTITRTFPDDRSFLLAVFVTSLLVMKYAYLAGKTIVIKALCFIVRWLAPDSKILPCQYREDFLG